MGRQRFTQEAVIQALENSRGLVSVAARALDCNAQTIENYVARYPMVAAAKREQREATIDVAELALMRAVQNGEGWAISLLLKTIGKSRGYTERSEVTGADGAPITVETWQDKMVRLRALRDAAEPLSLPERRNGTA